MPVHATLDRCAHLFDARARPFVRARLTTDFSSLTTDRRSLTTDSGPPTDLIQPAHDAIQITPTTLLLAVRSSIADWWSRFENVATLEYLW